MTMWIVGDCRLSEPLFFNEQDKNVVILGTLSSDHNISLKVNNLLLLGKITTSKDCSVETEQNIFNPGLMLASNLTVCAKNGANYNKLQEDAIVKIRALGIDITLLPTGMLNIQLPQQERITMNNYLMNSFMDWVSFQRSSSDQIGLRSVLATRFTSITPNTSGTLGEPETRPQEVAVSSLAERRLGRNPPPVITPNTSQMPPMPSPPLSPT